MAWRTFGETETFHGNPCKGCGGTLRYKSSRGCVACARKAGQANSAARRARLKQAASA